MLPGKRMVALAELILRERPFGGVRTFLGYGLGFEEKPKSFLKLLFRERFLCFAQVLGMEPFTEIIRCRSRVDEGWGEGKRKSSDENEKLSGAPLHLIGRCATVVPNLNVLKKQRDTLCKTSHDDESERKLIKKAASRA